MNRDMIFTDTELNNNPLLRKMRERFTCSGNMTIGEIMRHRAERDYTDASCATVSATTVKTPVKTVSAPTRNSRRSLIYSCAAIALCTVILLAFIIPILGNFGVGASADMPDAKTETSVPETVDTSVETTESVTPESNFDNVMNSFYRVFGE